MMRALTTWLAGWRCIAVWTSVTMAAVGQPCGPLLTIALGYTLAVIFTLSAFPGSGKGSIYELRANVAGYRNRY